MSTRRSALLLIPHVFVLVIILQRETVEQTDEGHQIANLFLYVIPFYMLASLTFQQQLVTLQFCGVRQKGVRNL